jgi:hypothetical protein
MTRSARVLAAPLLAALLAAPAQAGLIPASVSITPEAGNFRWTYAVVLPTDMKLQAGSYFTVYDFGGLLPGSEVAPDGWTVTVARTTPPPSGVNPVDDPGIDDLTFRYSGPSVTGQIGLGNFWAVSTVGTSSSTEFTASNPQASNGNIDHNLVSTIAPSPPGAAPGVPEPGTLALACLGLPLAAGRLFRRPKRG